MIDFMIDYPPNKIDSYIRRHTIYIHDIILLTVLIWIILFILLTFFSRQIIQCITGQKENARREPNFNKNFPDQINDYNEYEYEYDVTQSDDVEKINDLSPRSPKISHVKSADRILHLVNINDQEDNDNSPLPKPKSDFQAKSNENINNDKDDDSINNNDDTSSVASLPKENDRIEKPNHKRKRRKSNQTLVQSPISNNDEISDTVVVSISPIPSSSTQNQKKYPKIRRDLTNKPFFTQKPPPKLYPKINRSWNRGKDFILSSSSSSESLIDNSNTFLSSDGIYYSNNSLSFFGFDYSDSW